MEQYLTQISKAVMEGDRDSTVENVQTALDANVDVISILQEGLIPAMREVGTLFEEGEYFVPEMLNLQKGRHEHQASSLTGKRQKNIDKKAAGHRC